MKILLAGASGQLGQELLPLLARQGDVTTVDCLVDAPLSPERVKMDLADLNRVEIFLNRLRPDLLVNAAAYTAVDAAENDSAPAFRLNADLPGCMARWAERNDAMLVHYSTDYVFDGEKDQAYLEKDETRPLNVYGESKLAGEWAIVASKCRHIILRSSWVYSAHGSNFVLSMLRLARERPVLNIVSDQTGCPTWARNLAHVSDEIIGQLLLRKSETERDGLYHYCDRTVVSWYDFARSIFSVAEELGMLTRQPETKPVNSTEFRQVAERPAWSVLDTTAIRQAFKIEPSGMKKSLRTCLQELRDRDQK
jgi:dTDP-4-dehydrorhamnose reductase